jgi:hypothetical protein
LRRRYALEPLGGPEGFGQSGGRAAALQKFLAGVFAPPFRACASGDLGGSAVFSLSARVDSICKKYRVAASLIVLLMCFDASRRTAVDHRTFWVALDSL